VPKVSGLEQGFARVEAALREEIAAAEAAVARTQERKATVDARLAELLRVKELIAGAQAAETPVQPKAKTAAKPKARRAAKRRPRRAGGLPEPGTGLRAIVDAIAAGARSYREICETTGFSNVKIGGVMTQLVKRRLVVRTGPGEYAPAEGVAGAQPRAEEGPPKSGTAKAAQPKAKRAAKAKVTITAAAPGPPGAIPGPGTATRAVLDVVLAGARRVSDIREQTGFSLVKVGGLLPDLVRRNLVVRVGAGEYAPAEGAGSEARRQ
jgi:uncharacterized protein YdbL (DUF1318 family)